MKPRIQVYDSGDKYIDRYTVVYVDFPEGEPRVYSCVGMSDDPFSPQGFGQHGTAVPGKHLGKRIRFKDLPPDCKRLVMQDLKDLYSNAGERPMGN